MKELLILLLFGVDVGSGTFVEYKREHIGFTETCDSIKNNLNMSLAETKKYRMVYVCSSDDIRDEVKKAEERWKKSQPIPDQKPISN